MIRRRTLGALGALVALVLASCDRGPVLASPPPVGPFVSGTPVFETNGWIEYIPGDAPLIIIAPHGGRFRPFKLPERKCGACLDGIDDHTTELARLVADSFATRTGHRPHLVLNLLHRSKLDANRDMLEATAGNHVLEPTWHWLHASIDSAKASAVRQAGRGLVIDLHGHAHKIDRVEVGYLLAAHTFRQSDDTIIAQASRSGSNISAIAANSRTGDSFAAMHNGPNSLGGLLAAAGLPAVPSHTDRAPKPADEYFTGAFNTYRHGSAKGGLIDAMQLEMPLDVIGDTPENLQRAAGIVATALAAYLERHYGWTGAQHRSAHSSARAAYPLAVGSTHRPSQGASAVWTISSLAAVQPLDTFSAQWWTHDRAPLSRSCQSLPHRAPAWRRRDGHRLPGA